MPCTYVPRVSGFPLYLEIVLDIALIMGILSGNAISLPRD